VTWKAFVAKADMSSRYELGPDLVSYKGIARYLAAGEWSAEVVPSVWARVNPWMPVVQDAPSPLFVVLDGPTVLMAGPIRTARLERRGADTTATLEGVDDYAALLGSRLVWPQPGDAPPWTTSAYHVVVGQASTAIAELISRHRGDLALPERQGTPLDVTDQGAGPAGTWQFRLTPLIDAVSTIGREAGVTVSVTRRLTQGDIAVLVAATRNRTNLVLDDSKLGDSTVSLATATQTTVVAGGGGEGTARLFAIAGPTVSGDARIEAFTDQRSIDSQPALQRSADATRAAGSASTAFAGSITAQAATQYVWHQHYELGDRITLRAAQTSWPVTVEAVTLTWDTTGQRMEPILGTTPRHALAQLLLDVTDLSDRLNNVEVV
jgi:hypothetical protein